MIQAAKHTHIEIRTTNVEKGRGAARTDDSVPDSTADALSILISAVIVAACVAVAFFGAHALAPHCTSTNAIDLMQACGAQIVLH